MHAVDGKQRIYLDWPRGKYYLFILKNSIVRILHMIGIFVITP